MNLNTKRTFDSEERSQQIEEGARLAREENVTTLPPLAPRPTLRAKPGSRSAVAVKKEALKGHEAFLKALETSGAVISIEKCDGTKLEGVVKHSDKYTISVRQTTTMTNGSYVDRVIFKHDISEFSAVTPRTDLKE
jgi:sRNA-binding regulator protein Hfq